MLKGLLILTGFLSVAIAGLTDKPCLYPDELWGSEDGTKFYFCFPPLDVAVESTCPQGTFFVRNDEYSGCIKNYLISDACKNPDTPVVCTGAALLTPQPSVVLTEYYVCKGEGLTPTLIKCKAGTAFLVQNGYSGCFPWNEWRQIRGCNESFA